MDKNILIVGAALVGLLALTRKGVTSSPSIAEYQPAITPIIQTPALQAVQEALANFRIVDTGQDFGGADILQDLTLPGNPLILQSGIVTLGPTASANVMGCGDYKTTGKIWDSSTGACHDIAWYKLNQPGLAATWGL